MSLGLKTGQYLVVIAGVAWFGRIAVAQAATRPATTRPATTLPMTARTAMTLSGTTRPTTRLALTRPSGMGSPNAKRVPLAEVPGTRVTLKFKSPEPGEVFDALVGQAKLSFDGPTQLLLGQDHNHMPDVELEWVTFWDALTKLSEYSPYVFKGFGPENAVILGEVPAGAARPPAAVAGPFMVTINRIDTNLTKSVEFVGRTAMNVMNSRYSAPPCGISLYASAEPRLKPVRWYVDKVECVTDTGKKLEPFNVGAGPLASGSLNAAYGDTQLRFETHPGGATSITRLRLEARFVLERKRFTLEVPKLAGVKEKEYRLQDFRAVVHELSPMGSTQYSFSMTLFRDNGDAGAWQNLEATLSGFPEIMDSRNRRMMMTGGGRSYNGSEIRINFNFNRYPGEGGEPEKLTWSFVSETAEVAVPLEFRNVQLP